MTTNKYHAKKVYYDTSNRMMVSQAMIACYRHKGKLKLPSDILCFDRGTPVTAGTVVLRRCNGDSKFEFKVYRTLVDLFGSHAVICHYPIELIPSGQCYPEGKDWKIDFAIKPSLYAKEPSMLIEAKGVLTESCISNLVTLELTHPEYFNALYLIFERALPTTNRVIRRLLKTDFQHRILLLEQFVELEVLQQAAI
ncbi:MAG: hypothetical protein QNJ41_18275 [Xenococcaceae cyanobacterium MO_188.B32]|nr:hypothetical protein [Xenococcaceae cyanobacterium MO_188.B32]